MLVYDVTNEQSFNSIGNWIRDVQQYATENVSIVLVGNKADLSSKRVVSTEQGQEFAKQWGLDFFETSAKTSINVNQSFEKIIKTVISKQNVLKTTVGDMPTIGGPKKLGEAKDGTQNTTCCG